MDTTDPVLVLAQAKQRGAAARARTRKRLAELGTEDGTAEERATLAEIEADTRAIKRFTAFFRQHPRYAHGTMVLPSGKKHRIGEGGARQMERAVPPGKRSAS
jgi:hypothetical protein